MKIKKIGSVCLCLLGCLFLSGCDKAKQVEVEIPYGDTEIIIDGMGEEWMQEPFLTGFVAPWNGMKKDQTEVSLFHDNKNLYFLFRVKDNQLVYGTEEGESSVNYSDRVELFFCKDQELETYYCAEIDPKAKVLDYKARFYRKFDFGWDFDRLLTAATIQKDGYTVEGSLSLDWLRENGILSSDGEFFLGLYRGDASDPTNEETIVWLTWNIPEAKEPDFHIPSSLSKVRLQAFTR